MTLKHLLLLPITLICLGMFIIVNYWWYDDMTSNGRFGKGMPGYLALSILFIAYLTIVCTVLFFVL